MSWVVRGLKVGVTLLVLGLPTLGDASPWMDDLEHGFGSVQAFRDHYIGRLNETPLGQLLKDSIQPEDIVTMIEPALDELQIDTQLVYETYPYMIFMLRTEYLNRREKETGVWNDVRAREVEHFWGRILTYRPVLEDLVLAYSQAMAQTHEGKPLHLPKALVNIAVIESSLLPFQKSRAGAQGMWQIIPSTWETWARVSNTRFPGHRYLSTNAQTAFNILDATWLSVFYFLKNYQDSLFGNWEAPMVAYNAGSAWINGYFSDVPLKERGHVVGKKEAIRRVYECVGDDQPLILCAFHELPIESIKYVLRLLTAEWVYRMGADFRFLGENQASDEPVSLEELRVVPRYEEFHTPECLGIESLTKPMTVADVAQHKNLDVATLTYFNHGVLDGRTGDASTQSPVNLLIPSRKIRTVLTYRTRYKDFYSPSWSGVHALRTQQFQLNYEKPTKTPPVFYHEQVDSGTDEAQDLFTTLDTEVSSEFVDFRIEAGHCFSIDTQEVMDMRAQLRDAVSKERQRLLDEAARYQSPRLTEPLPMIEGRRRTYTLEFESYRPSLRSPSPRRKR